MQRDRQATGRPQADDGQVAPRQRAAIFAIVGFDFLDEVGSMVR
jgi:hypothetical protein